MQEEVIYITQYNIDYEKLTRLVLKDYENKCVICGSTEKIRLTQILPEEIYTELAKETWNNIPLCKYCAMKLDDLSKKEDNGIKNLLKVLKEEYEKRH